MIERDIRWENVFASVHPALHVDEKFIHIRITIQIDGVRSNLNQLLSERQLSLYPGIFGLTLDKMVETIDAHMKVAEGAQK